MGVQYKPVLWNRQKRIYDFILIGLVVLYLAIFLGVSAALFPQATAETLIIRATGTLAILMLHIILLIGPLSRFDTRFLPLLYNRRHLGVTMFLIAFTHGVFSIIQFHTLGDANPLVSLFLSNGNYDSIVRFPFQSLGFLALIIFFLMAVTSHDFWLHNLSPRIWKALHMMVYIAYGLVLLHVALGVLQEETADIYTMLLGFGFSLVVVSHIGAAIKERRQITSPTLEQQGFYMVCKVEEIVENRAKVILLEGENIAIFKYDGKLSAINNVCKHQNGPLGEGKIVDGCITCPWHGYQYQPEDGASPPPFTEKVSTYSVKVKDGEVWVNPIPFMEGTYVEPAKTDA